MSISLSFGAAEQRRSWVEQVRENSARLARVGMYVESTGAGEVKMTEPLVFGISFTDVPHFTSGYEVKTDTPSGHFPLATAFVYGWVFNAAHTLCTGAYIGFVIDDAEGNLPHRIAHHLRFEGEAIKTMPPGAL
jgi:hypothetical protein